MAIRLALMVFALVAVAALTVDLVSLRLRAEKAVRRDGGSLAADALIEVSTATNRYQDPAGLFSIKLPPAWEAMPGADYDVTLKGPHQMELGIVVRRADDGGMDGLREHLRKTEERLRITTSVEETQFQGRPAFRRSVPLNKIKAEAVDVLAGGRHVHLMASAPKEAFDELRPALVALMESVELAED